MVTEFDPSQHRWTGAIPKLRITPDPIPASARQETGLPAPLGWFDRIVPAINQTGDSCVGQGWANWVEAMLRNDLGRAALKIGQQIDGYAIYRRGREMFWNGTLDGGLYLPQGFAAAVDLGILPADSQLVDVNAECGDDLFAICRRLAKTPLVQAHKVHPGWYRPNRQNGCIDHTPDADLESTGGHCTLRVGFLVQDETPYWALLNSWGQWGWHGVGLMTVEEDLEGWLYDGPYTVDLPARWYMDGGWRKYITTEAR